jgi:hypothetical protein
VTRARRTIIRAVKSAPFATRSFAANGWLSHKHMLLEHIV